MLKFFKENKRLIGFGLLLTFFSGFGQTFLIALYVPAIGKEFGFSNSLFGILFAAVTLLSAACLPFAGKLIDRYPIKNYSIGVLILLAFSLVVMASSIHPVILFMGLLGLRLAGQGLMGHTSITSMSRHFNHTRGKAISMASLGHPLGEAILPILIVTSISSIGWRYSLLASAGVLLIILLPYVLSIARLPRISQKEEEENQRLGPSDNQVWTQRQVLRSREFWLICPNMFLLPMISTGLFFYQISLASFKGWQPEWVALCFVCFAIASSLSMLLSGILVDRWKAINLFPFYFIPYAIGLFILCSSDHMWIVPVYLTLLGITNGFGSTIKSALQAELFGTVSLGTVRSVFSTIMVVSSAAGPALFGIVLDGGMNFNQLLLICLALTVLLILQSFRVFTPYTRKKAYVRWKIRTKELVFVYQK